MNDDRFRQDFIRIGANIKHYRNARGLTQQVLADMAGISRGYLSQIEAATKRASLSVHMLLIIAEALEVHPGKLVE